MAGGFFLGLQENVFSVVLFLATLLGMSLVMAAGCVFNNCIDRDIDALMERTQNRVMVKNLVSIPAAISYAALLAILGVVVLSVFTNLLTVYVALAGLFVYVIIYSLWAKRRSIYGTAVGGLAGAVPPVVGYCAVTNRFDIGAIIVFAILFFWQIPHSYAIAIYRHDDYEAASIPVLPVRKGAASVRINMLCYVLLFTVTVALPFVFNYKGSVYLLALLPSLYWLYSAVQGFFVTDLIAWARRFFLISIIVITVVSLMMLV